MEKLIDWKVFQENCNKKQPIGNPETGYTEYCSLICTGLDKFNEMLKNPDYGICSEKFCPVYK